MNKENLLKLAKFLDELPEDYKHFYMSDWVCDHEGYEKSPSELKKVNIKGCGYVACAIGHAPQALGLSLEEVSEFPDWELFINHYFKIERSAEHWMFGPHWTYIDNTPKGAAKRIRYFLENGVPTGTYDYRQLVELYKDY